MNRNMRFRPTPGSGAIGNFRNLEQLQQRSGKPQQKMTSNNRPFNRKRQYGNEHTSQNYVSYDSNQGATQNFAYLYDDGPGPSYDRGYGPNKKRQKVNVWDIDMFGNNQNPGIQHTYTVHQNSPPRPLMSLPGLPPKARRISNAPPKAHKNFPPSKATKPFKPKPSDQPIKSLAQPADKDQYILRADKVPCQQMVGRLELALGSILKDMKANLCITTEIYSLFTSKVIQRSIKQTIRERIKSVMLNKHVGKYVDIIEAYRKRFPQNTDKDVLDMAVIKTGTSEQLIKQSFDKVLIRKVNTMFKKLQVLIDEKDVEVAKLIEARQVFKDDSKTDEDIKQSVKIESDYYASVVDSLLGARLPKILPNYASCIVKMLKRQGLLAQTDGDDANNDDSGPLELPDSETDDDIVEVKLEPKTELNIDSVPKNESIESVHDEEMTEANDEETTKDVSDVKNEGDENIEMVTVKKEPEVNTDTTGNNEIDTDLNDDNAELDKTSKETATPASALFLVKVLCQPELPSKAEAYKFLNKFNMVSVKKHKSIQNLLVVGFDNEKDFNDILAATGTVIEKSTLTIKGNKPQASALSDPKSEMETTDAVATKDNQLLTPELENQITDLLTSISEQKEYNDPKIPTDGKTEMNNENAKSKDNINLYSPSHDYDEEAELDTIKETEEDESQEDGHDPAESNTTEAPSKTDSDEVKNAKDVKTTSDDIHKSPTEDMDVDETSVEVEQSNAGGDKTNADVDKTNTDVDKAPAESIGKDNNEDSVDTALKLNKEGRSTPIRSSSRLASTPSNVRTRRASRLAQNN